MLEVIVDSNVIVHAVLNNLEHEECFEILKLIRTGKIVPVTSKQLFREYNFALIKVVIDKLIKLVNEGRFNDKLLKQILNDAYDCSSNIAQIMEVHKLVNVISKEKICILDSEDNKLVNLAIDANCPIIITQNKPDFMRVEEKHIKTKKGEPIRIYDSREFCDYYYNVYVKLKQFERKSKP